MYHLVTEDSYLEFVLIDIQKRIHWLNVKKKNCCKMFGDLSLGKGNGATFSTRKIRVFFISLIFFKFLAAKGGCFPLRTKHRCERFFQSPSKEPRCNSVHLIILE